MGLITRHIEAPFADGEILDAGTPGAAEGLEFDVAAFYSEFNGHTDDVNLKTGADLSGTKILVASLTDSKIAVDSVDATVLLDGSIDDSKVADGVVTAAKIAANTLSSHEITETGIFTSINQSNFTQLISETIVTTEGSGAVMVMWLGRLFAFPVGTAGVPGPSSFRLKRGGTILHTMVNATRHFGASGGVSAETTIALVFADTARPGGVAVEYSIEGLQNAGDDKSLFDDQHLTLVNLGA